MNRKFIDDTVLQNLDNNFDAIDPRFETVDKVFIESFEEIKHLPNEKKILKPTDYAIMNNVLLNPDDDPAGYKSDCEYLLRSAKIDDLSPKTYYTNGVALTSIYNSSSVATISPRKNDISNSMCTSRESSLRPSLHLNLSAVISAKNQSQNSFKLGKSDDCYTLEFGQYPKTFVGMQENSRLEMMSKLNLLTSTGKTYLGRIEKDGKAIYHHEYEYKGQKYVRVSPKTFADRLYQYSDGSYSAKNQEFLWVKVEPIVWEIKNWEDLPKELNPDGTGKAEYIDIRSEKGITCGIPFYPNDEDENRNLWQNSTIRGYLNGINVKNITSNGFSKYNAPNGGDFTGKNNFLTEAFDIGIEKRIELNKARGKLSRLERFNPDKTPVPNRSIMTDTEMIKSWIDAGQSVLLRGPSGIGKTERIRTLYPNLIYIKLTNNMFPEKVVGSMNLQTGEAIPPDFAKQAILNSATEEEKKMIKQNVQNLFDLADTIYERSTKTSEKTVIMLDELLNVKPAIQSLVYTLVLNKIVETGKGLKLPANTVVVATGNQKKYSAVAEDLAEPLEKRFDHILDMEPKVGEWLNEYAIPNKIHPTVIGYIFSKYQLNRRSNHLDDIGYFYEEPEVGEKNLDKNGCRGRTNDPRGWVSISNTLYAFEEDLKNGKFIGKNVENLLEVTISSKLREEWAKEFYDFYIKPVLTIEDVVEKRYTRADLPKDSNEKFACIASLLSADESQVAECREFIRKHCDPEYLSVYEIYWAGNDLKRIEKISDLQDFSLIERGTEL